MRSGVMWVRVLGFVVIVLLVGCTAPPTSEKRVVRGRSALAVPEARAAEIGAAVLREGGNAVDAAVAVHFALSVTFPVAGNIGGGGFMLISVPGEGEFALDYRETAPAAAGPDLFLDKQGEVVEGLSLRSHLAVGVPGSVRGMWQAHQRFGRLEWRRLLAPAIELAAQGFRLDEWTAASFARARDSFARLPERYARVNNFAATFHGEKGQPFVQPELAAVLRRIAEKGAQGFYEGETARLIAAEMRRGEGLITERDLADYKAKWREPVEGEYRGYRIVSMSPPSSGGIALIEMLHIFESFDLPAWHSVQHLHLVAEIEKRVFADRAEYLGDTDFYPVPIARLIDKDACRERGADISLEHKSAPDSMAAVTLPRESLQTTHFTIVDADTMAVTNTTTLNAAYGSGLVVEGGGFLLNNEMDDFSAKPGVPNLFGVTGGEANKVESGKRMLSSMTPTLVFDPEGRFYLALGSPGGPTIITTVFQVISNKIDYDMPLAKAVAASRFHHQWPPRKASADPICVESREEYALPAELLTRLETMGYTIETVPRLGDVQAVGIEGGGAVGVADPRLVGRSVNLEHQP